MDARQAGGVYLWETYEQANGCLDGTLKMIRARFGVKPKLEIYHTPVIVYNLNHQILPSGVTGLLG